MLRKLSYTVTVEFYGEDKAALDKVMRAYEANISKPIDVPYKKKGQQLSFASATIDTIKKG